ncbi:MAG: hypothetical protein VYC21_03850 [Bacteroidota bacterium]|jgi:hypothetical protein|nr:hypothetical protein [Bacteroidota bacterium]MEC8615346.1 hypothetical protein [Bacteroidota bacterium]|tara:strand:+ start:237 stop:389 length:153 start_codon:yes stop_codon:yes gene_type:complete
MKRRLQEITFPEGIKSIFINGRSYSKKEFDLAKKRDKYRDKRGKFVKQTV